MLGLKKCRISKMGFIIIIHLKFKSVWIKNFINNWVKIYSRKSILL